MNDFDHDQSRYLDELVVDDGLSRVDGLQSLVALGPDEELMRKEDEAAAARRADGAGDEGCLRTQVCRIIVRYAVGNDPAPEAVAGRVYYLCRHHAPGLLANLPAGVPHADLIERHAFAARPLTMHWGAVSEAEAAQVREAFAGWLRFLMKLGSEPLLVARMVLHVAKMFDLTFLHEKGLSSCRAQGRHLGGVRGATITASFKRDIAAFVEVAERREGRNHGSFKAPFQKTATNVEKLAAAQRRSQGIYGANRSKGARSRVNSQSSTVKLRS